MAQQAFTVARLAQAAGVGVETIRYYERRGLLAQPRRGAGTYREYDRKHVARIRFVKRAQELGFTLAEIETLLRLDDGADRATIREIASTRLSQIRDRVRDLRRMEKALAHVLAACERHAEAPHCPIIEAIGQE